MDRLREKLRATFRSRTWTSPGRTVETSDPDPAGLDQYFRLAQAKGIFEDLDGWMRRKLRCILWRQWKRPRTRAKKLMAAGPR